MGRGLDVKKGGLGRGERGGWGVVGEGRGWGKRWEMEKGGFGEGGMGWEGMR